MHRHVRGIRDQGALCVEQGAGEIQPLADVDGDRGRLQHGAHLFRDLHVAVVVDLEQGGIGVTHGGTLGRGHTIPHELQLAAFKQTQGPPGLDDGRGIRLNDQCRSGDGIPG